LNSRSVAARKNKVTHTTLLSLCGLAMTLLFFVASAVPAFAAIEGTVTNGTANKASKGDEVTLLELMQGMNEVGNTKTDASGHYRFDVQSSGGGPHLVRVTHQGVSYFKMVPPGMTSGDVTVYDAAKRVGPLSYSVETAFQTNAGSLQVVQFYVVRNSSQPPQTQTADSPFEIVIPQDAKIDSTDVQPPGGQPIQASPNSKGSGRYTFDYPMRPGETTFRVMYDLPYSGQLAFNQNLPYPVQQYAVITPQSMGFQPGSASQFTNQPHQGGVNVQIATNLPAKASVGFTVSGTGQMPDNSGAADQGGGGNGGNGGMGGGAEATGRPGGGLGTPIDTPDPLTKYRWPLLLGFAVLFVFGAFYMYTHRQTNAVAQRVDEADEIEGEATVAGPVVQRKPAVVPQNGSSLMLDAMKEELFQLEVDRQLGHISTDEYTKTKAAFDATLKRALSRQTKKEAAS
jgi:hypothetical protein